MKLAICQVADAGPLNSLAIMLNSAGYEIALPDEEFRATLKGLGCDTVLAPEHLTEGMGYDPVPYKRVGLETLERCDLYVDIKAHRNGPKIWDMWPELRAKTLLYRINGGEPVITERGGDEINLPCPILTPNLWYRDKGHYNGLAYVCWPPFAGWNDYQMPRSKDYTPAVCLIHNLEGWGHADIAGRLVGVKCYGSHGSPDGLIRHDAVRDVLRSALAMVHLKSNDCPGYALYEALAAGCPVIVSRRLIWRMLMGELFVEGENCLCFDVPGHQHRTPAEADHCAEEIGLALNWLRGNAENALIGEAGRNRLKELMWNEQRDGKSFQAWMRGHFG